MDKIAQKALKTKNMKEVEKAGREFIMGKLSTYTMYSLNYLMLLLATY